MKKAALYLILLTFIICLSACNDIESQEVPTLVSSEEVLTNDVTPEPVAEQKWVLIKETTTYPNSDESVHYIYEYDAAGNMTRKLNNNLEYLYKYDNNGLLIGETVTYSNGDKYPTDYMYDSNGNMIKKIERDYQGNDLYIYEYEYDSDGKLIIEKDFEGCTTEYEYDISGKLKKVYIILVWAKMTALEKPSMIHMKTLYMNYSISPVTAIGMSKHFMKMNMMNLVI